MTTKSHKKKNRLKRKGPVEGNSPGDQRLMKNEKAEDQAIEYQAVMKEYEGQDPSLAFFELANASCVHYRIGSDLLTSLQRKKQKTKEGNRSIDSSSKQQFLSLKQNSQAQTHTGGVIWETSYLLLEYLLHQAMHKSEQKASIGPKIIEVGAGCGLLGLALAAQIPSTHVVLTETKEVLDTILLPNLHNNKSMVPSKSSVKACSLDWLVYEDDAKQNDLQSTKFDMILGTDVVFSTKLVEPLLATMNFLSHDKTIAYLCLQSDRCPSSFQILLNKAAKYHFRVTQIDLDKEDWGDDTSTPAFVTWGSSLECHLLRLDRLV